MPETSYRAQGGRLVEVDPNSPEEFLRTVREALGRRPGAGTAVPDVTALSRDRASVEERAEAVRREAEGRADDLMDEMEEAAAKARWTVARVGSIDKAARYVDKLAQELDVRSLVRSAHPVVDRLGLDALLSDTGVEIRTIAIEEGDGRASKLEQRSSLRQTMIGAGLGLTGVDYAIVETGSCVVVAGKGVSRIVSLLPPAYVAIVEKGQVLPSLDELFTLQRHSFLKGEGGSYMNIISSASTSADIEQTLVRGVHGPGDVHMVLVG